MKKQPSSINDIINQVYNLDVAFDNPSDSLQIAFTAYLAVHDIKFDSDNYAELIDTYMVASNAFLFKEYFSEDGTWLTTSSVEYIINTMDIPDQVVADIFEGTDNWDERNATIFLVAFELYLELIHNIIVDEESDINSLFDEYCDTFLGFLIFYRYIYTDSNIDTTPATES